MEFLVTVTREAFVDEQGEQRGFNAFRMNVVEEEVRLQPKRNDKRLINYLLDRYNYFDKPIDFVCNVGLDTFRDPKTRKTIEYLSFKVKIYNREFKMLVKDEDKEFVKYLLDELGFYGELESGEDEEDE